MLWCSCSCSCGPCSRTPRLQTLVWAWWSGSVSSQASGGHYSSSFKLPGTYSEGHAVYAKQQLTCGHLSGLPPESSSSAL